MLWGHVIDDEMGDEMRVTMVATGLGAKKKMTSVQGGLGTALRTELVMPVLRTGTDNHVVTSVGTAETITATTEVDIDTPTYARPRATSGRSLEIPTFLRKQAD